MTDTLLGLSGSLRKGATNTKLIHEAARLFEGAVLTMANLNIPLYDGDEEAAHGLPTTVDTLVAQIRNADGVLISTPEYNSAITGVLKNALDWISRSSEMPWLNKPVAVMSAAAGRAGGVRAQTMLRSCMVPFRVRIATGPEVAIADSGNAFDETGQFVSDRNVIALTSLMQALRADIDLTKGD